MRIFDIINDCPRVCDIGAPGDNGSHEAIERSMKIDIEDSMS